MSDPQAVLLIYVEPTPYVLGFIRCIRAVHRGRVDAIFITANLSQPWNLRVDAESEMLPRNGLKAAREIRRRLASRQYDLLHLAGWGHPLFVWAAILAFRYRIPVFMESDTQLSDGVPFWKRAIKRVCYPLLFTRLRRALPAGARQAAYFRHYDVLPERITIAQMTVDVAEIRAERARIEGSGGKAALREEFGLPCDDVVFIFVGRLEPRKGISTLLDAFDALATARGHVSLLVVGDGTERPRVEAMARRRPVVKYAGRLDSSAVVRALCSADIAVVPSLIEPFGLVVNEAMAAGLPVIVSDRVGCVDDLIVEGQTGVVFPAGSADALCREMALMLDDPAGRQQMGQAASALISRWTLADQARIIAHAWEHC